MQPEMFETRNVHELEAFMGRIYSPMRVRGLDRPPHARITRRVLAADIAFDDLDYAFDLAYWAAPPNRLMICDVVSNTVRADVEQTQDTFGPGDQFAMGRPGFPYAGVAHAPKLRVTVLAPAVLEQVAGGGGPVRVLDHRPISRSAQVRLMRAIASVRGQMMTSPQSSAPPLIVSTARQYLAANVLHAYPNTAVTSVTAADRRDAKSSTLQRAVEFIDSNPDQDIALVDIARAACVSPRALQLTFRRHLDTTPMAYLRRARLDRARQELRSATGRDGRTVTEVAARWGFTSSAFAKRYRAVYGQSPQQTLRN